MIKKNLLIVLLVAISISTFAQKNEINSEKSKIKWTGKKIGGSHYGEVKIKSGYLELKNDQITGGKVIVDMTTISNTDLTDASYNKKLVGHLKSDDFFGVEKYPTATFSIKKATKFKDGKATVSGNITIKGKTESISFVVIRKGNSYSTQLQIDRSKFDVRYGSNSFFDNLGDKAINDIFILDIKLTI